MLMAGCSWKLYATDVGLHPTDCTFGIWGKGAMHLQYKHVGFIYVARNLARPLLYSLKKESTSCLGCSSQSSSKSQLHLKCVILVEKETKYSNWV